MKILLVEDEIFILDQCRKYLQSLGFTVTMARNGQEATDAYTNSGPFDLVITDYRIPKKDGAQLIKEIFATNPRQKVIIITAYNLEYSRIAFPKDRVPVLTKPFSFEELTELIEKQAMTLKKVK